MKKYSRKREAILELICSSYNHPSAEWVYEQLKPEFPDLSLATVYRNIGMFVDEGTLVTVGVVNGHSRYDGDIHPHAHFICDCCGSVSDVNADIGEDAQEAVSSMYGCEVRRYELCFRGICRDCAAKSAADPD